MGWGLARVLPLEPYIMGWGSDPGLAPTDLHNGTALGLYIMGWGPGLRSFPWGLHKKPGT